MEKTKPIKSSGYKKISQRFSHDGRERGGIMAKRVGVKMLCPECEAEMESTESPIEYGFKIPFFDVEVFIRKWDKEQWFCVECYESKRDRPQEEAYDAGFKEGMKSAEKEMARWE